MYLILGAVILLFVLAFIYDEWTKFGIRKRLKRNDEVARFRQFILFKHTDLYARLPTYDEMLNSNNSLTIDYYFPNFKTENSNETTPN